MAFLNELTILLLSGFVLVSAICRIDMIRLPDVRYRFAAVPMISSMWAMAVVVSMLGGDDPSWYQAFGLLVPALVLYNDRHEWKDGVPQHAQSAWYVAQYHGGPDAGRRRVRIENLITMAIIAPAFIAAAAGAIQGQGFPIQIYSAHSEPAIVPPGGQFDVVYDIRRVRACSGEVDRFIVNSLTNAVVQTFERQPLGGLRPGRRATTRVSLVLADLSPGAYVFRAVMTHNCPDGRYIQYSPDVPVVTATVDDPFATIRTSPPGSVSLSQPPIVKVPAR